MFSTLSRPAQTEQPPAKKSGFSPLIKAIPLIAVTIGFSMSVGTPAHAQETPVPELTLAGTSINNQAAISYDDESGARQSATSNPITTLVQQVGGVNLENPNNRNAAPLTRVTFPHIITNTGNGNDVFDLSAVDQGSDGFNIFPLIPLTQPIYPDANGDGVPDGILGGVLPTPISVTPTLAPGETFQFVVAGNVPLLASGTAKITVKATSRFNSGIFDENEDTVNASNRAVVEVVKSIDLNNGTPGSGPYTYTLTYTNSSNTDATALNITDPLPLGVSYVPNSGTWTGAVGTALGDGTGGDPAGINYSYGSLLRTVNATIASVPKNTTGKVTFKVNIDANLLPGIIKNFALYSYNDGSLLSQNNITNTVNLTALQIGLLTYLGDAAVAAPQNSTVTFGNLLTNLGTGIDTFNITKGADSFPAGTTFSFFKSDGVTPLVDTNNDNIPDTGPVNPILGTYLVVVKAKLPPQASTNLVSTLSTTATSIFDPSKNATAIDTLAGILPGSVDLTNALDALGLGIGPELTPVTNLVTDLLSSGDTVRRFELYIKNGGASTDNFDLLASANAQFAPIGPFPAGVKVVFKTEAGAVITNTGPIAPGATLHIHAEITLSAGLAAQDLNFFFRVASQVTGLVDTKLDGITINPSRALTLTPNNSGQTFRGGSVVYTHTLSNNGTAAEGGLASTIALATTNSGTGFTSLIYRDSNADNTYDDGDALVTGINSILLPGQSTTLFVKVTSPNGVASGTTNTTTLTATNSGGLLGSPAPIVSATDLTTILSSQLNIQKSQALDSNGDGLPESAYSATTLTTGAIPGRVIRYRIVVTNTGTAAVTNARVTDAIPAHTTYDIGDGNPAVDGTPDGASWFDGTTHHPVSAPSNGTLTFDIGTIQPGQTITVTFGVKIN